MRPDRAYIRLQSGRKLDLLDPHPAAWTDADLAVCLSRTYRWGGHSIWDLPLSVAQHSLLVLVLRQQMQPHEPLTPSQALRENRPRRRQLAPPRQTKRPGQPDGIDLQAGSQTCSTEPDLLSVLKDGTLV